MQQHSLAHAILSPILVIGLFAALVAGLLCQHTLAKQLELASAQRAEGITESLAFFADASAQHEGTLRRAVEALGAERDIEWVFVALGDPGTVIASTRHAWMDASVDSLEFQPESSGQRTYFYDTTVINPAHPDSFLPARCAVRLDISQTQRQLGFQVLWLSLGLCLSIVGILWISAHVIQKRVLDPVSSLVQSIDARAAQQTTPAKLHFCDEIGKVATSLNRLYESEDRHHQELGAAFRELQLASQAKDDFMAAMSHELRTPLNAIIGFSESLNSGIYGPIDTKQTKAVTRINKAGHHLLSIVDEVMTVSNSKSQQLTLHPQRCDLREIVHFCCSLVEPQLQGKDVRLEVEVPEAPCLLEADKDKL
ncbi:MAG: HAMP domain-containing histidine kinase, partial [Chlamydiia bacterium]|nr:HAMP domain-containing histidine kinase [Chlamydiia bacterium]